MRTVDLIQKKRDGGELSREELAFLIQGYTSGRIPDYQLSAWAMAVYFRGMSARETADLTLEMAASGDTVDLHSIAGVKVDKHSTGGVGDTVSLVLAPLVAAAGVPVAKMSGRGLGHTGGTIDKLEAISGFKVELTQEQFVDQVNRHGVAIIGQSGNITPADKKLYGLRDVTATVNSIPLIASSIMSKKIASGADAIVLDVKTGSGAFMKTLDDSIALAQAMVAIGTEVGRETVAVISSMDQPLGVAVGNALEVRLAVETLKGHGPADLEELCRTLGSHMLVLGGKALDTEEAREMLSELIAKGYALKKFKEFVACQGGSPSFIDQYSLLPTAKHVVAVEAPVAGYVAAIEAEGIGVSAMLLGAGRETKEAAIDLAAGLLLRRKIGDRVEAGEPLVELHTNRTDPKLLDEVKRRVLEAYRITDTPVEPPQLILAVVTKDGVERVG
ncbi:pyrimidine-nucleoside phosphorylase [Paenibacillus koleovorans]|uniref:pyrimidine-nucleoside phosphorylase n=1 Tax=Paenibacillus koleovorans TaxID=121608 RepID=UPI000FDB9736|nr:pyrimidine-nucleoside phosphorylase [Paenibacillus koleovorans]